MALRRMRVGQRCEITIPHLFAYGTRGLPPDVPPRATIIVDAELLELKRGYFVFKASPR